jgi:hypothetical protein
MTRSEFARLQLLRPEDVPFWEKLDLGLVAFIDRLAVRLAEVPQFISTWRSPEKNEQVGGKPTSFHLTGKAADLLFKKTPLGKVYEEARLMDKAEGGTIGGVGLYLTPQADGHTLGTVHLDTGPRYADGYRPRLWGRPEDGIYTSVSVVLAKLAPGGTVVGVVVLLLLLGLYFSNHS